MDLGQPAPLRGLQFNASYTLSKSVDFNSLSSGTPAPGFVEQNSFDLADSEGLSDYDVRHRFVINAIYDLPFTGNAFKEGWEIGLIVPAQGGNPINVVSNIGTFTGTTNTLRPDLIGDPTIVGDPTQWFDNTVCDPRVRRLLRAELGFCRSQCRQAVSSISAISDAMPSSVPDLPTPISVASSRTSASVGRRVCNCEWKRSTCSIGRTSASPIAVAVVGGTAFGRDLEHEVPDGRLWIGPSDSVRSQSVVLISGVKRLVEGLANTKSRRPRGFPRIFVLFVLRGENNRWFRIGLPATPPPRYSYCFTYRRASDLESAMLSPARELESLKFLDRLFTHLKRVQGSQKALRHVLRDAREMLEATHGCIAIVRDGGPRAQLLFAVPKDGDWDLDLLGRFIRHEHPPRKDDLLIAPLRRRGGAWAALAFMRRGRPFERHDSHLLGRIARHRFRGHPDHGSGTNAGRARPDRPEDHGAAPSEGSLLPDPGRPALA